MTPAKLTLSELADRFLSAERILIVCHTGPDGDAVGSSTALALLAEACGIRAVCTAPDRIADRLSFIIPDGLFREFDDSLLDECDTVMTVDTASVLQLGSLSHLAENGKIDFMLDHHATGSPYADCYVDGDASAAGEIVFELYECLRERGCVKTLPALCRAVYAAISSDTGSFKFSNVTPKTHMTAAKIVECISNADDGGMPVDEIARCLYGRRTMNDIRAQGLAIEKLRVYADGEIGAVLITADDYLSRGLDEADVSNSVETPRSLAGVRLAVAVRQKADARDTFKASCRSNCEINVADICAEYGGGGHAKAAGCSLHADSPEEALARMIESFENALGGGR